MSWRTWQQKATVGVAAGWLVLSLLLAAFPVGSGAARSADRFLDPAAAALVQDLKTASCHKVAGDGSEPGTVRHECPDCRICATLALPLGGNLVVDLAYIRVPLLAAPASDLRPRKVFLRPAIRGPPSLA